MNTISKLLCAVALLAIGVKALSAPVPTLTNFNAMVFIVDPNAAPTNVIQLRLSQSQFHVTGTGITLSNVASSVTIVTNGYTIYSNVVNNFEYTTNIFTNVIQTFNSTTNYYTNVYQQFDYTTNIFTNVYQEFNYVTNIYTNVLNTFNYTTNYYTNVTQVFETNVFNIRNSTVIFTNTAVTINGTNVATINPTTPYVPYRIGTNALADTTMKHEDGITKVDSNVGAVLTVGDTDVVNMLKGSQTNSVTGAFTILHATNGLHGVDLTHIRWIFVPSGGPHTLTIPSGWRTNVYSAVPPALTNGTIYRMVVACGGPTSSSALQTNSYVSFEYYK